MEKKVSYSDYIGEKKDREHTTSYHVQIVKLESDLNVFKNREEYLKDYLFDHGMDNATLSKTDNSEAIEKKIDCWIK